MPITRELTAALVEVVRERVAEQGRSLTGLAQDVGMNGPTLTRQLRGQGVLTVDEWNDLAAALGMHDLEGLLAEARTKM